MRHAPTRPPAGTDVVPQLLMPQRVALGNQLRVGGARHLRGENAKPFGDDYLPPYDGAVASRAHGISAPGGSRLMADRPAAAAAAVAVRGAGGVTEARFVAAEIFGDLRAGELLDPSFDRRAARLDARDRRWTRELVYGMLRRRSWLDAMLTDRVRGGIARLDADLADLLRSEERRVGKECRS